MRRLAVAFRALLGVDDIGVALHANGGGRTVELAGAADGALRRDNLQGHNTLPDRFGTRRPRNGAARLDATIGGKQESFQFASAGSARGGSPRRRARRRPRNPTLPVD